ncbi:MAG: aspartate aminotransferase family protein [Flavobacteriales bacterium]
MSAENDILLQQGLAQTTLFPFAIEIDRAEGIYLYDTSGKRYIDFISGIGVSNIGHGNRSVLSAIHEQVDKHLHVMVYGEYIQAAQQRAASSLQSILPETLNCCYFVNSGTEANEAAMKLAKRLTSRHQIISFRGAYHGNTQGSMSISSNEYKKRAFRPLIPGVQFIDLNDRSQLQEINEKTAAVFLETIQGDAGIRIPTPDYLQALRYRCSEVGAMLVFDKIQCGMGRTGKFFAFEHYGVRPDILTLGKALGGGMPVGCMIASSERMKALTHDPMLGHISTFAGHPVVCAAVHATIEWMKTADILTSIERKSKRIVERLGAHPRIREIRAKGFYFALDMATAEEVHAVVMELLNRGLISFWFLSCPWSFRIAPPLILSDEELEEACDVILDVLNAI